MSQLLLKIAKIIPRLDSDFEAEQLAALAIIRKLLLSNVDDDHTPPRPQPLKFVDVGEQLKTFILTVLEEPEIINTVNPAASPPRQPQPSPVNPSFHNAGTKAPPPPPQKPQKPYGDGWVWDDFTLRWKEILPATHLYPIGEWGSARAHWLWDPLNEAWVLKVKPPQPRPRPAQSFYKQSWHEFAPRSISDYEKRCNDLIDKRAWKNPKDKDFLESCYFRLSNNQGLTPTQLSWFHDISDRLPF